MADNVFGEYEIDFDIGENDDTSYFDFGKSFNEYESIEIDLVECIVNRNIELDEILNADENDEIEINLVQDSLPPVKLLEPHLEDIPSFRVPVVHYICQNCSLSYKKEKFYNQHLEKCKVGGVGGGMKDKKVGYYLSD